jgi:hypothetical protein
MVPTKEIIDALYREEVLRARQTPPDEKFAAGFTLFEYACAITKDGIRNQFPDADETIAVIEALEVALLSHPLRVDPQMSFETITGTIRNIVELTGSPFTVELFHLAEEAFDQEHYQRRRRLLLASLSGGMPAHRRGRHNCEVALVAVERP